MVPIPSSNSSPNSTPYFTSNKAQEILPESSPSLEALAQSPLHGSTRRANERASPVKFAMEDAVPPVSEMLDMVGRTYGDSARSWLKNTISASHRARSDVEFLKEENERLRIAHRGRQAESSDQSEAIKTLKRKIREKNTELKEYELYKDVMESTVTKQSKELREAIEQRDKLRARLKKETTNASKQVLSMKQKVSHAKKQGKAAKMEVEGSIQKLSQQLQACKRTLKTRDDALLVLENTFMASEQENRALIARVAASGDTIKALENDFERDCRDGYTHQGPQRADIKIKSKSKPAVDVLSRGQEKSLVCALTIPQAHLYQQSTSGNCVFLIDDLAAELDKQHIETLTKWLTELNAQVLVTGVNKEELFSPWNKDKTDVAVFHVKRGEVESVD